MDMRQRPVCGLQHASKVLFPYTAYLACPKHKPSTHTYMSVLAAVQYWGLESLGGGVYINLVDLVLLSVFAKDLVKVVERSWMVVVSASNLRK